MSSRFAADTIPRDLRLILEQGVEIQNIWWLGKTVFSGEQQHEGVEIASRPPGGGRQKFIPVKHTLSEKSLVEEWATLVKSRSARNRSENKVLVDKFMKLRPHVGYKFETLSESEFKDVVGKVFPVKRHADHIREIDRQVELVQKDPTKAPEWARDLAKLRELKAAAKKAKDAGKAEVGGAPPLTEVAKKLLPPETPEKPKLNEYKLVTLYPQSHHPALATQPLVLQSHDSNTWIEEQALRADWAKDFDPDTGKMWTQQDRDEGKPAGARKRRLLEYMARKPFENPLDGQLTQVLFPVPVDW
eukprot:g1677.t1